jgi:hypothetical protein
LSKKIIKQTSKKSLLRHLNVVSRAPKVKAGTTQSEPGSPVVQVLLCTRVIIDKLHKGRFPGPRLTRDPIETLGTFEESTKVGPISMRCREYPFKSLRIDFRDMLIAIVHLGILQVLQNASAKSLNVLSVEFL